MPLSTQPQDLPSPSSHPRDIDYEALVTLKDAAKHFGLPYFKVQRAASAGIIPTYFVYNSRRLVKLSDLAAIISASRQGGVQ